MTYPNHKYKGAGALVELHEERLRSFHRTWKLAKAGGVILPVTDDPDYISMETLLVHILRSAGNYMRWICDKLNLADPGIEPVPAPDKVEREAETYIPHIIEKWQKPLINVPEEKFFDAVYKSNWGPEYCIEAMLEHAVMHPVRHEFQLKKLLAAN
ncbi:MAG: hypothetical protein ACM3Q2_09765 [Syntrophothermus sp.]